MILMFLDNQMQIIDSSTSPQFSQNWNWLFWFSLSISFFALPCSSPPLSWYDDVTCSGQWLKIWNTVESLEPVSWHTIGRSSTSHSIFWPAKKRILLWSKSSVLRCHFILLSEWWVSCHRNRIIASLFLFPNLPPTPPKATATSLINIYKYSVKWMRKFSVTS